MAVLLCFGVVWGGLGCFGVVWGVLGWFGVFPRTVTGTEWCQPGGVSDSVEPRLLYGLESIQLSRADISKLDKYQRDFLRQIQHAYKYIPSKTSRSVSSVPLITPGIRRKNRRKNATHAKAKSRVVQKSEQNLKF